MHALHGNGTTLESVHGAVRVELSAYVEHLDVSGILEEWLKDGATVKAQTDLAMQVQQRQQKSPGGTQAGVVEYLLVKKLEQLAKTAREAEVDANQAVVHFITLLWKTNLPPFYYLLTWASRHSHVKAHLEQTFVYLHWAMRQIEAPTVLAAERACRDVADAPRQPAGGGALLLWRGLTDETLLTGFKDDVRAGCPTAFSMSPAFGDVLVCVEVSMGSLT